jgi:hypothetical protein
MEEHHTQKEAKRAEKEDKKEKRADFRELKSEAILTYKTQFSEKI